MRRCNLLFGMVLMSLLGLSWAVNPLSAEVVVPAYLFLQPGEGISNELSVTMAPPDIFPQTDTTTVSGSLDAALYVNFDPDTRAASVTGIGFIGHSPGTLSFSDMYFYYDLGSYGWASITIANLLGDLHSPDPPYPVNDGAIPTNGHRIWMNSGILTIQGYVDGENIDDTNYISDDPLDTPALGDDGTLTVSAPYLDGGLWKYDVKLIFPFEFATGEDGDLQSSVTGWIRAVGTFAIPEPGCLAMLGMASIVALACLSRRIAR